jgi:F-type H+-transporting ATPase subunit delta
MEDIAQVYARSLFEVADEQGDLDEVREQLAQFSEALADNRALQLFFFSPQFSTEEKKDGLRGLIEGGNERFVNFLELLVEKHRMPAIARIQRVFDELWREENKLLPVEVTSAVELDQGTLDGIGDRIEEQTGRRVELTSRVDPEILGGLRVRVGNMILDATIRNKLERLRKQVAKAAA